MEVTLRMCDGTPCILEIPDSADYPEVLIYLGCAFKLHPKTDEYVECTFLALCSVVATTAQGG